MLLYFINLDRENERRGYMERQFAELGLVGERIAAVTPADIAPAHLKRWCDPARSWWQSPTELACSMSHAKAMAELVASGAAHALILEDDVILSPRLPAFLAQVDALGLPADVLRIETNPLPIRLRRNGVPFAGHEVFASSGVAFGAGAYLVTAEAAKIILDWDDFHAKPADHALFEPYDWVARQLKVRHLVPALAIQTVWVDGANAFTSALEAPRAAKFLANSGTSVRQRANRFVRWFHDDVVVGSQQTWHQLRGDAQKRQVPFLGE